MVPVFAVAPTNAFHWSACVWLASVTIMSFHADASVVTHTRTHTHAHCGNTDANLTFCFLHREINYLYPVCTLCVRLSSFVLLRFRFSLSFETPMLSQTGVCHCIVQVGFATVCVCVCVWSSDFFVQRPWVIYVYECVCASWLLFCGLLGCWIWA